MGIRKSKKHIQEEYSKNIILDELAKLQDFIHQATFIPQVKAIV